MTMLDREPPPVPAREERKGKIVIPPKRSEERDP
jgi:hypothetical protein